MKKNSLVATCSYLKSLGDNTKNLDLLKNKNCLVTGVISGMGKEISIELAKVWLQCFLNRYKQGEVSKTFKTIKDKCKCR